MLERYHKGAFGLAHKNRWSCCGTPNRVAIGCEKRTNAPKVSKCATFGYKSLPSGWLVLLA